MKRTGTGRVTSALVIATILAAGSVDRAAWADVFRIELDYMVEGGANGHSHQPTSAEIAAVVQMFACQGHTLIVDVDDALTHYDVLVDDPENGAFFSYDDVPNSFGKLKNDNFDHNGQPRWHYCIFGHQYDTGSGPGSSGIAELSGDDLLVSLGAFANEIGTPFDRASTLAHEFGHNLGLTHCGNMDCDETGPFALNVASVMSYFYQLRGVATNLVCQGLAPEEVRFRDLDYSHGTMCTLDEAVLSEALGTHMASADWDCSGAVSGIVSQDLNAGSSGGWCGNGGSLQVLSDYDEWANIQDGAAIARGSALENLEIVTCITSEETTRLARGACAQPSLVSEPCDSNGTIYMSPAGGPFSEGTCIDPCRTLADAVDIVTTGGIVFITPGSYSGGGVIVTKEVELRSVGTATIQ